MTDLQVWVPTCEEVAWLSVFIVCWLPACVVFLLRFVLFCVTQKSVI